MVLALMGVLITLSMGNAQGLLFVREFEPPDKVLRKAVLDAIYYASASKDKSLLAYNEKNATFEVLDSAGNPFSDLMGRPSIHRVYEKMTDSLREDSNRIPQVRFEAVGPSPGPEEDGTNWDDDQLELTSVPFHYNCTFPFRVTITFREKEKVYYFDPFSGYQIDGEDD